MLNNSSIQLDAVQTRSTLTWWQRLVDGSVRPSSVAELDCVPRARASGVAIWTSLWPRSGQVREADSGQRRPSGSGRNTCYYT